VEKPVSPDQAKETIASLEKQLNKTSVKLAKVNHRLFLTERARSDILRAQAKRLLPDLSPQALAKLKADHPQFVSSKEVEVRSLKPKLEPKRTTPGAPSSDLAQSTTAPDEFYTSNIATQLIIDALLLGDPPASSDVPFQGGGGTADGGGASGDWVDGATTGTTVISTDDSLGAFS
jgi:hypothetical protein